MIIDNFDLIAEWFKGLESNKDYYMQVEIIQRKKDGVNVGNSTSNDNRSIKKFYPTSVESLLAYKERIIDIVKRNNARAYIYPAYISKKQVYHKLLLDLVSKVTSENFDKPVENLAPALCSQCLTSKYLIFDVDSKDPDKLKTTLDAVSSLSKSITVLNTVNGFHILCKPFNYTEIEWDSDVELKTKNPTLLYYENE
jgi:hypothetical protein